MAEKIPVPAGRDSVLTGGWQWAVAGSFSGRKAPVAERLFSTIGVFQTSPACFRRETSGTGTLSSWSSF